MGSLVELWRQQRHHHMLSGWSSICACTIIFTVPICGGNGCAWECFCVEMQWSYTGYLAPYCCHVQPKCQRTKPPKVSDNLLFARVIISIFIVSEKIICFGIMVTKCATVDTWSISPPSPLWCSWIELATADVLQVCRHL